MDKLTKRPEYVTEQHLIFLDELRESGKTNMFGAGRYVSEAFGIGNKEANDIVGYWMETFGKEDR